MSIILTRNFQGAPHEDFPALVRDRARRCVKSGDYDFVYVVPTRRRVRELERDLLDDVAFGKLPVYTFDLFARNVFSLMQSGKRIVSPSAQGMIVGRVISSRGSSTSDRLRYFGYASPRPGSRKGVAPAGTIKKIVDQIDYLRENGITPEDYRLLVSAAEKQERRKLEEFLELYVGYEKEIGETLVDAAGLLACVNRALVSDPLLLERICPKGTTFLIEGFYNFKKPEIDFLKILSARKDLSFLLKLDCSEKNERLFRTMLSTSRELEIRGFVRTEASTGTPGAGSNELRDLLAMHLFADDAPAGRIDLREKAFVVSVRDNLREAEFVAEKIKEIVSRNPAQKLDRICVASYLPQNYSRLFREVFAKYHIPANITDRFTLESNGVVNAILSFMEIRLTDYERVSLLRAVTNRLITVSEDAGPGEAASVMFNAAALCRFERGFGRFKSSIASRLAFLGKLAAGGEDENSSQMARDIATLRSADSILDSLDSRLSPFTREMSAAGFRNAVKSLVSDLGIHRNILDMNVSGISTEVVERDARALSAFLEVVDEVGTEGESRGKGRGESKGEKEEETRGEGGKVVDEPGEGKRDLASWMEDLRSALGMTRYNVRQRYGYGVYVTALEEMRGLEFDHVFIVGLNEGELPTRYNPDIFLPLSSQKENREMQPFLQRHLFYQAVSSFRKSIYLVYPVRREEVRLMRSSFIDAFRAVAETAVIDDTAEERKAANIYNLHQLVEAEPVSRPESLPAAFLPMNIERCKSAEVARYRNDRESEFNGRVTEGSLIKAADEIFSNRVFSAAQIESLSRCGFQFFVRRVLQAVPVPEIDTSISAIERGMVLHKILYRFYTALSSEGKSGRAAGELDLLLRIGKEVLNELGIEHDLFEVEKDAILGTPGQTGTLELFLKLVQTKLTEYGFSPELFEFEFGPETGEKASRRVEIGGVALRGKIDRVDSNSGGLTIFDYKTSGRLAGHRDVLREKISPQLLIYLAALGRIAKEKGSIVSGAAFISLNRDVLLSAEDGDGAINFILRDEGGELKYNRVYGSDRHTRGTEDYPKTMEQLLAETESFVSGIVRSARSGEFNLTRFPYEKVCTFCPYSEACRIAVVSSVVEERGVSPEVSV